MTKLFCLLYTASVKFILCIYLIDFWPKNIYNVRVAAYGMRDIHLQLPHCMYHKYDDVSFINFLIEPD